MDGLFNIPGLTRRRRKLKYNAGKEPLWVPPEKMFKAQRAITMTRTVTGHAHNDKRSGAKWQLDYGKTYYVDTDLADQYIIKGYATGELSRDFSDDEVLQIRSTMTNIGLEGVNTNG